MPRKRQYVTDAELNILKLLWGAESLTARAIQEKLYPVGTGSDRATVQKLLQRLEAKGLISRDRSSFAHVFQAEVTRAALVGQHLKSVADKLTDGSVVPLILHFVQNERLTPEQRQELRNLLDDDE